MDDGNSSFNNNPHTNKIYWALPLPFLMAGAIAFSVQYGNSQNSDYFYPAIITTIMSTSFIQALLRFSKYNIANQWFDYIKYDLFFYRIILMIFITPKLCNARETTTVVHCFAMNLAKNLHSAIELGLAGFDYAFFLYTKHKGTTLTKGNINTSTKNNKIDLSDYFKCRPILIGTVSVITINTNAILNHIENNEVRNMVWESASLVSFTYLMFSILSPLHTLLKNREEGNKCSAILNGVFLIHKISPLWISLLLRIGNPAAFIYAALCVAIVSIYKDDEFKNKRIKFIELNMEIHSFNWYKYLTELLKNLTILSLPFCSHAITASTPTTITAVAGVGGYFTTYLSTIFMTKYNITRSPSLNELLIASLISYFNALYFRSLKTDASTSITHITSAVISALIGLLWGIDSAHKTPWGAPRVEQNAATGETTAIIRTVIILIFTARLGLSDNNLPNSNQPQP